MKRWDLFFKNPEGRSPEENIFIEMTLTPFVVAPLFLLNAIIDFRNGR
jgi:hypothetical protein